MFTPQAQDLGESVAVFSSRPKKPADFGKKSEGKNGEAANMLFRKKK